MNVPHARVLACAAAAAVFALPVACRSSREPTSAAPLERGAVASGDSLAKGSGLLWFRTSAEYDAVCRIVYAQALGAIALTTAASDGSSCVDRPRAIVMDLDETVLDNSLFNIWLEVARDGKYDEKDWIDWVRANDGKATLVPGAKPFIDAARLAGVRIAYISNRPEAIRAETIATLRRLGAIHESQSDEAANPLLLLKQDKSEQNPDPSSKVTRRNAIENDHCVIALVGDNLADFTSAYEYKRLKGKGPWADRRALAAQDAVHWGVRWFALPNPMYGDWRQLLTDEDIAQIAREAIGATPKPAP